MRLTQKNDFFEYVLPEQNVMGDNQASEISLSETEYTCKKYVVGEAINKLGELEDVLEKHNIKNIEDLELRLEDIEHYAYQENQQVVDILAKYGIENLDILDLYLQTIKNINIQNANLRNELAELKQTAIMPKFQVGQEVYIICEPNRVVSGWKITDYEYYKQQYIVECKGGIDWIHKDRLFATREEAEQNLAEIGGNDD